MASEAPPHSYFALSRAALALRGLDATRGEESAVEAYLGGVAFYLLAYVWLVKVLQAHAAAAVLLIFGTWIFFAALVYLNSVIVRLLRHVGAFTGLTNSRAQNLVLGCESVGFAVMLARGNGWSALIGCSWLALVGSNFCAWVFLFATGHR